MYPPTNDEYCPDRQLTVGELAAMVRRAIDAPDTDNDYFTDDETSTFEGDLNALADIGVSGSMRGRPGVPGRLREP